MLPLLRLVVPSIDAFTPGPAVGLPWASRGGQNFAQLPAQALLPFLSLPNRYRVWPLEFTSTWPRLVLRTDTVPCVRVALNAIGPAARNPTTPSAAISVIIATVRVVCTLITSSLPFYEAKTQPDSCSRSRR